MSSLRKNIQVVLVAPRFPENIGMVARACGNMGVNGLSLVNPELWPANLDGMQGDIPNPYLEKALALATSAGREIIGDIKIFDSLETALSKSTLSIGATARIGGWRQGILNPAQAAELAQQYLLEGGQVSFVFGSESQGLDNEAIELCSHLVTIPTASEPSLNLAQAVLVVLYELSKIVPFSGGEKSARAGKVKDSPLITHQQQELLISQLKSAMQALDSLPLENANYFMLPIRRLITRSQIKRSEFSLLMGICTKILRLSAMSSLSKPE